MENFELKNSYPIWIEWNFSRNELPACFDGWKFKTHSPKYTRKFHRISQQYVNDNPAFMKEEFKNFWTLLTINASLLKDNIVERKF